MLTSSWGDLVNAEPAFAERVHKLFGIRKHMTLATLRRDGSPRISGTEVHFEDGELYLDMMPGSLKALDLRRDPRLALHSPTVDAPDAEPSSWAGDAKISGEAREVGGVAPQASHRFRVDVAEVVITTVGSPADHLVIESWHAGRGLERRVRR